MKTMNVTDASPQAAFVSAAVRERFMSGPGVCIAPIQPQAKGTSVPAGGDFDRTSVKHNPAAIKDGAALGLRTWRYPV